MELCIIMSFWIKWGKDLFIKYEVKDARGSFLIVVKQDEETVNANGTLFNS